jgi:hypothetical protein
MTRAHCKSRLRCNPDRVVALCLTAMETSLPLSSPLLMQPECIRRPEKAHIRMLCEQRLQSFVQKRGIGIWDYRLLDEEPIPDSFRYLVLKAAGGRCQLCGIAERGSA